MKPTAFSLEQLTTKPTIAKPAVQTKSKTRAPKAQKKADPYPGMTDWGHEFMKRLRKLHRIMDEEKIKFVP